VPEAAAEVAPAADTPVAEVAPAEAAATVPLTEAEQPTEALDAAAASETTKFDTGRISDLQRITDLSAEDDQQLNAVGVWLCSELLEKGASKQGRQELAEASGVEEKKILRWVNQVDLFSRLDGVNEKLADLLEAAGVDTVVELATRVPANLQAKLAETNAERQIVETAPTVEEVEGWVNQAKELPRVITY
jgi:predicted flap endonuclease-1-like 5' DNA nuclease